LFQTFRSNAVQEFKVRFKVGFGEGNFHVSGIHETSNGCVHAVLY
jgi:hypothetical protein